MRQRALSVANYNRVAPSALTSALATGRKPPGFMMDSDSLKLSFYARAASSTARKDRRKATASARSSMSKPGWWWGIISVSGRAQPTW